VQEAQVDLQVHSTVVELAEDPMALVQFLVASLLQVEVQEAAGINLP